MSKTFKPAVVALILTAFALPALAQGTTATPRIDQRLSNQEQRIEQGEQSGALTQREAATLEKREARTQADLAAAKSDGSVTRAERAGLHHELNGNSRAIARKKHNRRHQ